MNYELIKTIATDWSIIRYYKLPDDRKFTVKWSYSEEKCDFNVSPYLYFINTVHVTQTACYVVVVTYRKTGTFFTFDVLDEDMVTIRGKHCKGNLMYTQIYKEMRGL